MGGGGNDEPLRPTYNLLSAPWVRYGKKYTGQTAWWAEPNFKDVTVDKKQNRLEYFRFKEEDPYWYDPPVKDGTSIPGALGKDTKYNRNDAIKGDTPIPLKEWQEKLYKGSTQYKEIAKKWDISPEHPGIPINPGYEPNWANRSPWSQGHTTRIGWKLGLWGPRFFDKPLNEDPITKGLAVCKYAAFLMVPITVSDLVAYQGLGYKDWTLRLFLARYARNCALPFAAGFAWGVTMCTASNIRNKDDVYNHLFGSFAVGAVVTAALDNFPKGSWAAVCTLVLGVGWHYARILEHGLQGRKLIHASSIHYGPTAAHDWLQGPESEKPRKWW
uniref:NADH dehydrogenase [ubiquinone] 1 alpha subcomplex subunit 11 n=1 Tax=Plectus sambesii TaxID=2011161 RepID=A0A914WFR9_9BILA